MTRQFLGVAIALFAGAAALAQGLPTQDLLGQLHGVPQTISQPERTIPRPQVGRIHALAVTPDASKIVLHAWNRTATSLSDRVFVVDAASGKITATLSDIPGMIRDRHLLVTDADHCVFMDEKGLAQYDLKTGKISQRYELPGKKQPMAIQYSTDRKKIALSTDGPGALVVDLTTGISTAVSFLFLPAGAKCIVYPLAGCDNLLLVSIGEGDPEVTPVKISLFDPATGSERELTKVAGNLDVLPTADGKSAYVFRQEDPNEVAWTGIEQWNLQNAKMVQKIKLQPNMASIGLALPDDASTLFMLEYMVQPVVLWDLATGTPRATVSPIGGGCEAFDVTPDGKQVVASIGKWVEGDLQPTTLAIYDTSKIAAMK